MNLSKLHQMISLSLFKKSDVGNEDKILDYRDEDLFDSEWIDMYNSINQKCNQSQFNKYKSELELIRKDVFLTSDNFFGHHEISSYISDDFDLIAKAIIIGSKDKRITWLLDYYINHGIPYKDVKEKEILILDY